MFAPRSGRGVGLSRDMGMGFPSGSALSYGAVAVLLVAMIAVPLAIIVLGGILAGAGRWLAGAAIRQVAGRRQPP